MKRRVWHFCQSVESNGSLPVSYLYSNHEATGRKTGSRRIQQSLFYLKGNKIHLPQPQNLINTCWYFNVYIVVLQWLPNMWQCAVTFLSPVFMLIWCNNNKQIMVLTKKSQTVSLTGMFIFILWLFKINLWSHLSLWHLE